MTSRVKPVLEGKSRITSYNVCYTKLLRGLAGLAQMVRALIAPDGPGGLRPGEAVGRPPVVAHAAEPLLHLRNLRPLLAPAPGRRAEA